jgi:hypothetical protein
VPRREPHLPPRFENGKKNKRPGCRTELKFEGSGTEHVIDCRRAAFVGAFDIVTEEELE